MEIFAGGVSQDSPRTPNVHIWGPGASNTTGRGEGKRARSFWASTLRAPTFSRFGPTPPSGPHLFGTHSQALCEVCRLERGLTIFIGCSSGATMRFERARVRDPS